MRNNILRLSDKSGKLIRTLFHPELWKYISLGIDVDTYRIFDNSWFLNSDIRTIIDIGANTGQFTLISNSLIPEAKIYSFEPSKKSYEDLQRNTEGLNNIHTFEVALGEIEKKQEFYQNSFSQASSLLMPTKIHETNYPFTAQHESVGQIQVKTLDSFANEIPIFDNLLIKMDVQGYEDRVISGGKKTISKATLILIETSFVELYESSPLFEDIHSSLVELGFKFDGFISQSRCQVDGTMLWGDALFLKR
jgi:FkbM family methyltransferase